MPTEVASTDYGVIIHYDDWNTLELKWLPTTKPRSTAWVSVDRFAWLAGGVVISSVVFLPLTCLRLVRVWLPGPW